VQRPGQDPVAWRVHNPSPGLCKLISVLRKQERLEAIDATRLGHSWHASTTGLGMLRPGLSPSFLGQAESWCYALCIRREDVVQV
jgi:hypothetical protein